jgi:hypothetical protein
MNVPKIDDVWLQRWKFDPNRDELMLVWVPDAQRWSISLGQENIHWVEVTQAVTPIDWEAESRLILGGKAPAGWSNVTEPEHPGPRFERDFEDDKCKLSLFVELSADLKVQWGVSRWTGTDWKSIREGIDPDNSYLRSMVVCEELLPRSTP